MRAGIALGSNLGDRRSVLEEALANLRLIHENGDFLASSFLETDPVDCPPESPLFLNAVVELETSLNPLALLKKLQALEVRAGRDKNHGYHEPRSLDLDILYCEDAILDVPEIKLPHPSIAKRHFVLTPLAEIRPDLILPGFSKPIKEILLHIHK